MKGLAVELRILFLAVYMSKNMQILVLYVLWRPFVLKMVNYHWLNNLPRQLKAISFCVES